jgi:hypothetical protein
MICLQSILVKVVHTSGYSIIFMMDEVRQYQGSSIRIFLAFKLAAQVEDLLRRYASLPSSFHQVGS